MDTLETKAPDEHGVEGEARMPGTVPQDAGQIPDRPGAPGNELTLSATIESVTAAIDFVRRNLEELGCPEKIQKMLLVATDEFFGNIARYAYGALTGDATIRFSTEQDGRVAVISLIDQGSAFNPLSIPQVNAEEIVARRIIGGQGIKIARNIADGIEYRHEDGENVLHIRKTIKE